MGFRNQEFAFASPDDAVGALGARVAATRSEPCPLADARGRVLAEDVVTDRDSPPFDHSAMDGYAARLADLARGTLPVHGECRIGRPPPALPSTPAVVRIVTGAPIPPNAELVIKREDVDERPPEGVIVPSDAAIASANLGDHIRRRAENARAGSPLLARGTLLNAAALSALAAVGRVDPMVHARVRVALLTTGDEVVDPSAQPSPFEIRNSNALALGAILRSAPWLDPLSHAHVPDDADALADALAGAIDASDAVVLSGGVSMGHRDHVRESVERANGEILFHGLPQRPGKPMLGAISPTGRPILALPGNPLSAMITATRIVLPVLGVIAGLASHATRTRVRLATPISKPLNLWWHRLVRLDEHADAHLVDSKGSGDLVSAAQSHGFIELPPNASPSHGDTFPFFPWPE